MSITHMRSFYHCTAVHPVELPRFLGCRWVGREPGGWDLGWIAVMGSLEKVGGVGVVTTCAHLHLGGSTGLRGL